MDKIIKVLLLFCTIFQFSYAQTDSTATFDVAGNCGLCKQRIEKAAKIKGVNSAVWDVKTRKITVSYNSNTTLSAIQKAIAMAGHDTPLHRAPDEVYEKLHECCLYERLGEDHEHDEDDHDHEHHGHKGEDHDHDHNHGKGRKETSDHHNHEHIITGVVVNEDDKASLTPIANVNIRWQEGPKGQTTSNESGVFKIKHNEGNKHLVFTAVGMQPVVIEVKDLHEVLVIHAQNNVLSEVVVSRRKKSNYIKALNANRVEVLTALELFKAACCDLSESFETTISVDVVSSDAVTGSKQIQLLGLSGIYTQLTVENLPGPRGFASPLGLNSIAGTWIESIDISKGIGSVVNGYENMAGQINVELKKPHTSERLFFNAYANNMGRTDLNLNLAQKINDKWSVGLLLHDNFMYNKDMNFSHNGFRDVPVGNLFSGINRWHFENGKGLIAQFGVKYLKDKRTGGQTSFNKEDRGSNAIYGLGFDNERIEGFGKIGYVFPENRYRSVGLQLSASNYNQDSYFGLRDYSNKQTNGYANLIFQDILGTIDHKYKVGVSVSYDKYKENIESHDFGRTETVTGVFAEYTYSPTEKFDLVAGLRQDYNSLYGWFTTPRFVIRYNPFEGNTIRISTGRGQRTANIFAENIGMLASARTIDYANLQSSNSAYGLKPEVSWNTGITLDQDFKLFGRESGIAIELFHNNFENQVVIDWENPREVNIYNLDGKSYSNSLQAEFRFMPARHFEARFAYRLLDVKTDYKKAGTLSKPLTAKHRGFMNLAYNLHSGWSFDYTFNVVGKKRLPSTIDNPAEYQLDSYSPAYITMNAQVSKSFGKDKNFSIYVGGENLTNKYQKDPILAFDQPFGQYFDTNLLWGPLTGRMFYTGIRYHIK